MQILRCIFRDFFGKCQWKRENPLSNPAQSETVATILDHAVVREDSNDKHIHLELYLRLSQTASAYYERDKLAFQTMFSKQYTTVYQTAGLLPKYV